MLGTGLVLSDSGRELLAPLGSGLSDNGLELLKPVLGPKIAEYAEATR